MHTRRIFPLSLAGFVLLAALAAAPPAAQAQKKPGEPGKAADDKREFHVIMLKNADALRMEQILRELFGVKGARGDRIALTADPSRNALIVSAAEADLLTVMKLVRQLDDEPGRREAPAGVLRLFELRNIEFDAKLEESLKKLLPDAPDARITTAGGNRRIVIVYARSPIVDRIEALLQNLDVRAELPPGLPPIRLQVRLVWLGSGPGPKDAAAPPEEFKDVLAQLRALGLERWHVVTQMVTTAMLDTPFDVSGVAKFDGACKLTASGMLTVRKENVGLDFTLNAVRPGDRAGPLVSQRTNVTVPPGRPVLLAVTPTETITSAFVVQVLVEKPAPAVKGPAPKKKVEKKAAEKRVSFEFKAAPWREVLRWLSDQTGLRFTAAHIPQGTFSVGGPAKKSYTIPEVIDAINDVLIPQKYILLLRKDHFIVLPADEIDISTVPKVTAEELDERGRTELVCMALRLTNMTAEDVAPALKKLCGPFGNIIPLPSNQVIVVETAGNLRAIYKLVREINSKE